MLLKFIKLNDNALVALALLIAESDAKDKDILIKIVTNLRNGAKPGGIDFSGSGTVLRNSLTLQARN